MCCFVAAHPWAPCCWTRRWWTFPWSEAAGRHSNRHRRRCWRTPRRSDRSSHLYGTAGDRGVNRGNSWRPAACLPVYLSIVFQLFWIMLKRKCSNEIMTFIEFGDVQFYCCISSLILNLHLQDGEWRLLMMQLLYCTCHISVDLTLWSFSSLPCC